MMPTDYDIFFATHKRPTGWNAQADHLLYHFFRTYDAPGEMADEILPKITALMEDKHHPELPDDWYYFWGHVIPRKDYVYFFDKEDKQRVHITCILSWEGSALYDATTIENACTVYMKIPSADFVRVCGEWDEFNSKLN